MGVYFVVMLDPVLTLLVASALPWTPEFPRTPELGATLVQVVRVLRASRNHADVTGEAEPTVCDVPYYYSDFTPVIVRPWALRITYDWRSPVFFDVP